jgi:hypothetical protein
MIITFLASSALIAGTNLVGTVRGDIEESSSVVDTKSNSELRKRRACLIDLGEKITVTAKDVGTRPAIGATGAWSFVNVKHVGGVTLTGSLTYSGASCTVTGVRSSIGQDGNPEVVIDVEILSADGFASGIALTSV